MKSTLRWLYPEGASIIDAMLFKREDESTKNEFAEMTEKHVGILEQIHLVARPPEIVYPCWHIYVREGSRPFMVSYPFGLSRTQPYNVRLVLDQCSTDDNIYDYELCIRYNIANTGNTNIFRPILLEGFVNAKDYISLAAIAQSIFHSLFREHTKNLMRYNPEYLFQSVADYSSQRTILPAYNTQKRKVVP